MKLSYFFTKPALLAMGVDDLLVTDVLFRPVDADELALNVRAIIRCTGWRCLRSGGIKAALGERMS